MSIASSRIARFLVVLAVVAAVIAAVARLEVGRDLSRLHTGMLSAAPGGNYHAVVDALAAAAAARHGHLENVASPGSAENVDKLVESAAHGCAISFALVQDGQRWPSSSSSLELLGRLPRPESVLFLGKAADRITDFSALRGLRIGVGPAGSGTAQVATRILGAPGFDALAVAMSNHGVAEQIDLAARGELDVAVVVSDDEAPLVVHAVRDLGLGAADFPHAGVLVGHVPGVHVGRVAAGRWDPIALVPASDKTVLQLDTLVVGNGCASRSRNDALLDLLSSAYPDFIRVNQGAENASGLPMADAAKSWFQNGGADAFETYAPWLVDVMPPGKWVYIITALSLLVNAMGFGNRFQLWRIDAVRVRLEREITLQFGSTTTLGEIDRMSRGSDDVVATCERVIRDLEALAGRSRKMSLSILVPMGQEMAYRYQEAIIHETLAVLRGFLARARPK